MTAESGPIGGSDGRKPPYYTRPGLSTTNK